MINLTRLTEKKKKKKKKKIVSTFVFADKISNMALNSRTYTRSAQRRQDRTPKQSFTKLAVGAIDFGTTFSGYAYSLRSDFQKNPLQVQFILGKYSRTDSTRTSLFFFSFLQSKGKIFL